LRISSAGGIHGSKLHACGDKHSLWAHAHAHALPSHRRVKIGNALDKGVSGGQAKRTNIGIALITNPRVLFLDEVRPMRWLAWLRLSIT
jgi:ABC-type glutathione transport system ATPase component